MIAAESPKQGFGKKTLEYFVNKLKRRNTSMRIKL